MRNCAQGDTRLKLVTNPPVVILKTGTKLPSLNGIEGDFDAWIRKRMSAPAARYRVVCPQLEQSLPLLRDTAAIVVTGSAAMVTDHSEWIESAAAWLRDAVAQDVPVLGICFGHQLLAYALGGNVDYNPNGIEVGTIDIRLQSAARNDNLFAELPQTLHVHASHQQSVLKLPPAAVLLASSDMDPHHAFRVGACAWGLQFHPEFDAVITRAYVAHYREPEPGTKRSGTSPSTNSCYDTPFGDRVLRRFAQVVAERGRVDARWMRAELPGPAIF